MRIGTLAEMQEMVCQLKTWLQLQVSETTTYSKVREMILLYDASTTRWSEQMVLGSDNATASGDGPVPMEIDRIQQISNESHQNSQQLLHDALQENQVLVEKLKEQEYLLNQQRHEQTEMRSVIQGLRLQQQVDAMRSQPVVFENRTPENAAVNESELVQVL